MTGKSFRWKNSDVITDEMSAKKDRPWSRRRRKSCDFQGYHHRRQKELKNRILICAIGVNPLSQKKHPSNINHRQSHILENKENSQAQK